MDDSIRIRSGTLNGRVAMPKLKHAETIGGQKFGSEIGFQEDEKALYIGTSKGNVRLCGANDLTEINAKINNINTEISAIKTNIATINSAIASINARLDALETPSE